MFLIFRIFIFICSSTFSLLLFSNQTSYKGSKSCSTCHHKEHQEWQRSQHFHAQKKADLIGIKMLFQGQQIHANGETFRMHAQRNKPFVTIKRENKGLQTLPILYSIGHSPLQMFLVAAQQGALQVLPIAWDTRSKEQGGQRWFALYAGAGEIFRSDSYLHTWNNRCASCHTTAYKKNWDWQSSTFSPSFTEENVACEACHGPGSQHEQEALARRFSKDKGFKQAMPHSGNWQRTEPALIAERRGPPSKNGSLESCGRCHARRIAFGEEEAHKSFHEQYELALLRDDLYTEAGLIKEEVFELGSFLASKMHARGVNCVDCHNPHSGQLKREGNELCGGCHRLASYEQKEHTKHEQKQECKSCHMPMRVYMQVDERHDHRFSRPSPKALDACRNCHSDKESISQDFVKLWGIAFQVPNWHHRAEFEALSKEKPFLAASYLACLPLSSFAEIYKQAIYSKEPFLTLAALRGMDGSGRQADANLFKSQFFPIRVRATRLGILAKQQVPKEAKKEMFKYYLENLDLEENVTTLAELLLEEGDLSGAALILDAGQKRLPYSIAILANLADLERQRGNEKRAQVLLQQGLKLAPKNAQLKEAWSLMKIRTGGKF